MSHVGMNMPAHHGCGGRPPGAAAAMVPNLGLGINPGAFSIPSGLPALVGMSAAGNSGIGTMAMPAPERFASSMSGGVILGKDGAPAGRIPAGSFVDTKDGTIFGPDGKAITLPEGSTADFFDLPDVKELMDMSRMATAEAARAAESMNAMGNGTTVSAPGTKTSDHHSAMHSFVDGQWGPGGVTPIKGGGAPGCDMDHGATTTAGGAGATAPGTTAASTGTTPATPATAVAGVAGGGQLGSLTAYLDSLMDQIRRLTPTHSSGGGATLAAATGASALGSVDRLRLSVNDLVSAIGQLNVALEAAGIVAAGSAKAPAKTEAPKVEPPKTEVASTESGSDSDTTAPPASGSSSSS